jgi:hypothetical protein
MVINAGYVFARPAVTIASMLGVDRRRLRADMTVVKFGLV